MTIAVKDVKQAKPLPAPNSDFYQLADILTAEELAIVKQVRGSWRPRSQPIINKYWVEDAFPFELLPAFKELGIGGLGYEGYGCAGGSQLLFGFVAMEMARIDPSFCDVLRRPQRPGDGLDLPRRIGGAEAEVAAADGALGKDRLLRPDRAAGGSGASGGLTTTAKREGDTWVLNGQKRWIGNAPWCDISIIWARDLADNQVKGFIVENKTTPGFSVEKIENKIALKVVQNGQITLKDVPGAGGEPPAGRQLVPRHRAGAADDALHRGAGCRPDARWAPTRQRSSTPRSDCSSASRSARSSWCRTFSPRCSPTSPPASA